MLKIFVMNLKTEKIHTIVKELISNPPSPDNVAEINPAIRDMMVPVVTALKKYFRAEVTGVENYPREKALLVGNHNAGITFFEPFIMALELFNHYPGDPVYFLTHDIMVSLPVLKNVMLKTGSIRASHESTHKALQKGYKVAVYPGGNYEAFRPYSQRNRVDFGGKKGFIKLALKEKVPILPVCNVGGHETFFVLTAGHKLAEITGVKKYLRSESFPVFIGLPWIIGVGPIFHFPLPAKIRVHIGKPISLDNYNEEDANNPEALQEIYDTVISTIQGMHDELTAPWGDRGTGLSSSSC